MNIIGFILSAVLAYCALLLLGLHQIKEGYVGIYKDFGVLNEKLSQPGYHLMIPFISEVIPIRVNVQTQKIQNIPCGTADGTLISFERVEVVNKLRQKSVYKTVLNYTKNYEKLWISDKIHHQINQFCSKHSLQDIYIHIFDTLDEELEKALSKDLKKWAPGIKILSIRITKPTIPERMRQNFEKMQKKKIDYFIAVEREKVKIQEQVTIQKQKIIKEESQLDVRLIEFQKMIEKKQNQKKMAMIEADMIFEREKTAIQAKFLTQFQEAQLYKRLYTEEYLRYLATDAYTSNVVIKVGNKIPKGMMGKL